VISELLHVKNFFGVEKINFVDDSFLSHPEWLIEFSRIYTTQIRLPFIINVEATQVKDDLVRLLKKMGCVCVRMGVETGNEIFRRNILNKNVTDEQIRAASSMIKNYGIRLSTFNMLGLPGESVTNALETYELNKEIGSDFVQCSLLQPYPGTAISRYIKEEGYLDISNDEALGESYFAATKIKLKNRKEIINLQRLMLVLTRFRVPTKLVLLLIKFPENPLFSIIFRASYVYQKIRIQNIKIIPLIRLGLHSLGYMKRN